MMSRVLISSGTSLTTPKPNLPSPTSLLNVNPSSESRLTFTSHHHPKPISNPLKIHTSSCRTKPIMAVSTTCNNLCMNSETLYDLLGIPETGTFSEIKQAYKLLVRKYHPDVSPPECQEEYTKRFIKVKEAYEILSDPRSRALYDRDIAAGLHLAFSGRNPFRYNTERWDKMAEWRMIWQNQLLELKRRSMNRDLRGENMSWGTRMRRRKYAAINL